MAAVLWYGAGPEPFWMNAPALPRVLRLGAVVVAGLSMSLSVASRLRRHAANETVGNHFRGMCLYPFSFGNEETPL